MHFSVNLLQHQDLLRTRKSEGRLMIWCVIRRKWLTQTREELVRQLLIQHLHHCYHYPLRLIQVEKRLTSHGASRRFDILCYQDAQRPMLLIECKAPEIELANAALEQIAIYNYALNVPHLAIVNGRQAICCVIDQEQKTYAFVQDLPQWQQSKFD